jgi:protein phosphatase
VQIDLEGPHPIQAGDAYLLCSDGLTGRVEDAELGAILASLPPSEAAQALIDLANLRGGPDNITVLIAKAVGPEAATGGVAADPLRLGGSRATKPVHPAIMIVSGVCLLAAIILAVMGQLIPAVVALVAAAVAGAFGLAQRYRGFAAGTALGGGHMLGTGPYTTTHCPPSHELAQKLADTLDELREAAREGDWTINWRPLDQSCQAAVAADQAGKFSEAIRHYCRGISYVMKELRSQPNKRAGDSAVRQ